MGELAFAGVEECRQGGLPVRRRQIRYRCRRIWESSGGSIVGWRDAAVAAAARGGSQGTTMGGEAAMFTRVVGCRRSRCRCSGCQLRWSVARWGEAAWLLQREGLCGSGVACTWAVAGMWTAEAVSCGAAAAAGSCSRGTSGHTGGVLASPATPIPLKPPSSLLPSLLSLFLSLPSLGTSSWGRHASPFPSSFFLSSLFAASWHKLLGRPPPSS